MRIISGELKGKKLISVRGLRTRPTADHLRESIFNILSLRVAGSVVLDLFAGTGAFGIEALSRGAHHAFFLDNNEHAIRVIKRNITMCKLEQKTSVIKWNIKNNLNCIRSFDRVFDLIFLDPPYNKDFLKPSVQHLSSHVNMNSETTIVIEHSHLESVPDGNKTFQVSDQRRYGKTLVSFLRYDIGKFTGTVNY